MSVKAYLKFLPFLAIWVLKIYEEMKQSQKDTNIREIPNKKIFNSRATMSIKDGKQNAFRIGKIIVDDDKT